MAATKQAKTIKKRRRSSRLRIVLIMAAVLAILLTVTLLLRNSAVFNIKEITVTGNTLYDPEAILGESGLTVGMSVWSVNKKEAGEKVMKAFPYIEKAEVENTAYNKLNIAVTETREIGVMYAAGQWLSVGANGKILAARPVDSDRPLRTLYIKGADPAGTNPGEQAMSDRCWKIVTELRAAFRQYGLTGVGEIDLTDKSDLRLTVNGRILVRLGTDSNLTHEIGVVANALPGVEAQYGSGASGQLDVSAYSIQGGSEQGVFTPRELLPTTAAAPVPTEGETGETGPAEPEG